MATEKAPYKLTIKLAGAKPEKLAQALLELRERAAEYDQAGEAQTTLTIEAWQEGPLRAIVDSFETWLYHNAIGIECEVKVQRPGIRPETIAMYSREKKQTPMDQEGWEDDEDEVGSDRVPETWRVA